MPRSNTATIAQLQDRKYSLVTDSQDSEAVKDYVGKKAQGYDSFLVWSEDGDYREVWAFCGTAPYLSKLAQRLI